MLCIKTASWFTKLPSDYARIGISRGTPRNTPPGYRMYRKLAPGPWFHSVSPAQYYQLYQSEILSPLNPRAVADELLDLSGGGVPVLLCFENAHKPGDWCHRAMAAEWLSAGLGIDVPEVGFEDVCQESHPCMPTGLAQPRPAEPPVDLASFIGRTAVIDGETHLVVSLGPQPGQVLVAAGGRQYPTGADTLRRYFK